MKILLSWICGVMVRLRWLVFIASIFSVLIARSSGAEVGLEKTSDTQQGIEIAGKQGRKRELHSVIPARQRVFLITKAQPIEPITKIRRLSEIEHPLTNTQQLVQSPAPEAAPLSEVVQVTGVQANLTDKGVEVILQTTQGEQLQITNRSADNNFIADIPNAQLRLPNGDAFTFRSQNPVDGITEITVTNFDANIIRVIVVGEKALPTVELFDDNAGLVFGVASAATATQPPQQQETPQAEKPTSETPQEEPAAQQDEPIELVVTGEQDGYRVQDATTGTKTDTPLRDIPQSIQVIPRQVIEDQKAERIGDFLRNVSGVVTGGGGGSTNDGVIIRGFGGVFGSENSFRRNGLRDSFGAFVGTGSANIERIEVLKGPASVLFGRGSAAGTINIVTKKPLTEPYYKVEATVGNYDFYRGTLDFSGPLNDQKTLLYRLNAAVETSGSYIDFFDSQLYFVAPSLTWLISDRTKLTFELEYQNSPRPNDFGLPALGTVIDNPNGKIPRNRTISEPSFASFDLRVFRVGYDFEHSFNDNWKIHNAFLASSRRTNEFNPVGIGVRDDNRTLDRIFYRSEEDYLIETYALDTYAVGKFNTGSIQHQLVVGFDLSRYSARDSSMEYLGPFPLDLFDPVYGQVVLENGNPFRSVRTLDGLGIYVQDQITLTDNLKLLLGGRFDIFSEKAEDLVASSTSFQQDEAFSPRVGIVYQPIKPISLYANYSRSVEQVVGSSTNNNSLFEPERGTQYEVGIKADLTDRLSATLALYEITRSNVLTQLDNPFVQIQTGKQRSRGVEFDVQGEILPGWNVIANYAYTDARIIEDINFAEGNRLENVPEHNIGLWTTYQIQTGNLQGLGFGLGMYYVGERVGDLENTFTVPSYLRTDASIFYKQDRFRTAINIKNLFDIEYFSAATSPNRVYYGAPFTIQGSISWEF